MKTFIFCLLLCIQNIVFSMPNLQLPFSDSETWEMTRGYCTDESFGCNKELTSHVDYGGKTSDDRYALDFAYPNGCGASWGRDVVASSKGVVISAKSDGSYGNSILLDHGNGYITRYAHLSLIEVNEGELIRQGQKLGLAGNTGYIESSCLGNYAGAHIHFVLYYNGNGVKPEPMDGYTDFTYSQPYTSKNVEGDNAYANSFDFVKECIERVPYNSQCKIEDIVWYQDCILENNLLCSADGTGGSITSPSQTTLMR